MARYALNRLVWLAAVLATVTVVSFGLGALVPGDPAELSLLLTQAEPPTEVQIKERRLELGLDRPLSEQYRRWLAGVIRGDLGRSWVTDEGVAELLGRRLPATAVLAASALLLSVVLAIPFGLLAAQRQGTFTDHICRLGALVGASLPAYLLAYLLILGLAVRIPLLPVLGFDSPVNLVLPTLTLALGSAATLTRFIRSTVLDVMGEGFIRVAEAKGLNQGRVLRRHALRAASLPIVTMLGLSLGGLIGGAFVVEWIFNWPGVGTLAVEAINNKDYPVLQGFVLLTASAYVVVNFVTDLVCRALDPRAHADRRLG